MTEAHGSSRVRGVKEDAKEDAPVADRRDDDDEDTASGWGPRRRSAGDSALEAIVLLAGGYTSANDVLTRLLLAPGVQVVRAGNRAVAAAVLSGVRVDAVVLAPDWMAPDVVAFAATARQCERVPLLFAVLSHSDERASLAEAGIDCLQASSGDIRTRVLTALRTTSARRVR